MSEQFDFIAIGDVVTDAFVNLDSVQILEQDRGPDLMAVRYGDKIPFNWHKIIPGVGNSANAAVSATRLGLKTAYVANVGGDAYGAEQIEALKSNNIDTQFITVHENEKSNYHYVLLHKADRTILVKHTEFDYKLPEIGAPKWMYLSSMAENTLPHHMEIADYLEANPTVNLAFQPGTFQMKLGIENLGRIYKNSALFFCNVEEAKRILYTFMPELEEPVEQAETEGGRKAAVKMLLDEMEKQGPTIPVITDGPDGAYVRNTDGAIYWCPMYPDPKPPIDRTGAGDSFSSTFTAIYAETGDVKEALLVGPLNSMNVVQHVGAQEGLQTREEIQVHLDNAPEFYKVEQI